MTELPTHLLFLDLETEGLDPELHHVLEACAMLYDTEQRAVVGQVHALIVPDDLDLKRIRSWDEVVRTMHRQSGLLNDLADPRGSGIDTATLTQFDTQVRRLLTSLLPHGAKVPLAGYGVGHMEAAGWVPKNFPSLAEHLTYWSVCVSTLRRSLEYYGFELPPKGDRHRADLDCLSAIAEWQLIGDRLTLQIPLNWLDNGGRPATDDGDPAAEQVEAEVKDAG